MRVTISQLSHQIMREINWKEIQMNYEFIKYEVEDNGVAKVLLNRPEKLNALSLPLQAF